MFKLVKEVRDINRFNKILLVLFDEGFGYFITKAGMRHYIPLTKRLKSRIAKEGYKKPEIMLRRTLEKLGPTFIKFGQLLSVRPDLIPNNYCLELEKLQDKVPPFSFEEAKEIVEKSLGKSLGQIFKEFDKKPCASASISQVHRAVLKSGEIVAVKIQRPNAKRMMETDIEIMQYFAGILTRNVEKLKRYNPVRIVKEFKEWTEKELDFRVESRNAKRFYANFRDSQTVHIPKIYDELSSDKVITMDFIEGIELNNITEIRKRNLDFNLVMERGFDALLTQVFVHGLFHADPHPGNILVLPDNSIAFIDFGIVGFFDEKLKNRCIDILYGIVTQDDDLVSSTLVSMGAEGDFNYEEFKSNVSIIIQPLGTSSVDQLKVSKVLEDVLELSLDYQLRIPASLVLLGKTIITLEGIAIAYDPNLNIVDTSKNFIADLIEKRSKPSYMLKSFMHNVNRYKRLADELPEKAERALDKIQKGTIKVDIEDTDIQRLSLELDRSSNRIAYGLLIAALLITSAILMPLEKGPRILGVNFISFFCFMFAVFFILLLFGSIAKEKLRHF